MDTYKPAENVKPKTAKNATGHRLGHAAAELNSLRVVVNEMRSEAERREREVKLRDETLARTIDRFSAAVASLTSYLAGQEQHRNTQTDEVLRRLLTAVGELQTAAGVDADLLKRIDEALHATEVYIVSSTSALGALQNTILERGRGCDAS